MKRIIDERKSELSKYSSINEEHSEEWWRQPWLPEEMEKLAITMADFKVLLSFYFLIVLYLICSHLFTCLHF